MIDEDKLAVLELGHKFGVAPEQLLDWAKAACEWLAQPEPARPPQKRAVTWSPERRARQSQLMRERRRRATEITPERTAGPGNLPGPGGDAPPAAEIIPPGDGKVELYTAPTPAAPPALPAAAPSPKPSESNLLRAIEALRRAGCTVEELGRDSFLLNGSGPVGLQTVLRRAQALIGAKRAAV